VLVIGAAEVELGATTFELNEDAVLETNAAELELD